MSTLTSREFNQDVSRAKRDALIEPVFVTDRGRPTHVLLSFEAFRALTRDTETIVDLLAMSDDLDVDFEASRAGSGWDQAADLGKVHI
jgi:PHD/YefM family antitoxin component YafN of YafNO toxin-antitoxin module